MRPPALLLAAPLLAASLAASPAHAHAVLVQSTPAPLAHVKPGTLAATLRYNSRLDAARSRLTLQKGKGAQEKLTQTDSGRPDTLATSLTLSPGTYTLRWQVLAVDGHITRGAVPFTVDAE